MSDSPGALSVGIAGRYTFERELGRGGTAIVYLARDTTLDRSVAIKVLRPELTGVVSAERFLREVRLTAGLNHSNIVPVLDSGSADGVLFCVLPHMDGGTLRDRFRLEKQLPLSEVIAIGCRIAQALDAAHAEKLVHRDVKPENILFTRRQAYLADFGIARALEHAAEDSTTSTGIVRGTAAYMSPEQASGERDYDGRSDIYSLACVLYEATAGIAPFVGPTSQSVAAQRLTHSPRSLDVYRPGVPPELTHVLTRALAVVPADRYQTAGEFATALAAVEPSLSRPSDRSSGKRRTLFRWRVAGSLVVILLAGSLLVPVARSKVGMPLVRPTPDSMTYVLLPSQTTGDSSQLDDLSALARESLERWSGITVVDEGRTRVAMAGGATGREAARRLGAGRYVRTGLVHARDSVRLQVSLFDTRTDSQLVNNTLSTLPRKMRDDEVIAAIGELILFGANAFTNSDERVHGTTSFEAGRAYVRGRRALISWQLTAAETAFARSIELDPRYAQASLGLASVRQWLNQPLARWGFAAEQAAGLVEHPSSEEERFIAAALVALARGRRDQACARWHELTRRRPSEPVGWYGLGNCLRYDSLVVRDAKSPSGWRFRSSYEAAVKAYERALKLMPSGRESIGSGILDDIRTLMMVASNRGRAGRAEPPDSTQFMSRPSWQGDSLLLIPFPNERFYAQRDLTGSGLTDVRLHQRRRFEQVARMWRVQLPQSPEALEALGIALDLLGNTSGVDSIAAARRLATTDADRSRIGGLEVWMRVRGAMPDRLSELSMARLLADSLLFRYPATTAEAAKLHASLAALTGRAALAAQYERVVEAGLVPPALDPTAARLLAFAAVGGPGDSIQQLVTSVAAAIARNLTAQDQATARARWLVRPALLALPEQRISVPHGFKAITTGQEGLLSATTGRDLDGAHQILEKLRAERSQHGFQPASITMDVLYSEAAVLASLGDAAGAASWLDPALDSLYSIEPQLLADVTRAGSLVRAMILRVRLAADTHDTLTAKKWARPVAILWSDADAFLVPSLSLIKRFVR